MVASGSVDDFEDVSALERSVAALVGVKTAGIDTLIAADAQVNSVLIKSTITVLDLMTAGAVQVSLSSALSSADAATMWLGTVIESTPKVVVRNGESPTKSGEAGDDAGWTAPMTAVSPSRVLDDDWTSAAEADVKAAEAEAMAEAAAFANDGYRLPSVAPHAAGATPFPYPPKVPLADSEKITVVIISDRLQPLSAAIGSILMHSAMPLQIYIIAYEAGELQTTLTRTLPLKPGQSLEVLAMDAVTAQLVQTSFEPVWVWDEYGESTGSGAEAWRTKHTVQQEMWDHDPMHSSPFNHLRFYLPYLPFLADVDHLIFLDDDVIVQGEIAEMVVQMPPGKAIAAPCDTWVWGDSCSQFTFVANATDWRRNSAVLYLNSAWRSCGSDEACKISAYEETIQQISRNATGKEIDLSRQPVWNFGVVMYNCTEWRRLGMTERYHTWLRADYALHLWPEDSLSYGLGIPYLAFEGVVVCWNDLIAAPFRDGMGFISVADLRVNAMSVRSYLDDAIALHWSGRNKPWGTSVLESEFLEPWERTVKQLQLSSFVNERQKPERAIFLTEARSGSEWFMDLLDHHPEICATGDRNNPTAGFGREALLPEHYSGDGCGFRFPTCSVRLGCNWGFFAKWVPHYHLHYREWCVSGVNVPDEDTHRTHGWRLCEAARVLTERHPGTVVSFYDTDGVQRLWDLYEEHAFDDSSKIVPCSCQHQKVQMFKVMRSWFNDTEATRSTYRDATWFSGNFDSKQVDACGGAEVRSPSVDWSPYFVVEWRRRDLLAECVDTLYSDDSPVEYVSSTRADVGNIAGRWSEAWEGRPLNVSEITSCMRELKHERAARTSMRAAHPTDAKWLTLYYEDCVTDYEPCLLQIASLLGVDGFGTRQRYAFQADLAEAQRKAKDTWRKAKLKQAQDLLKHHELGLVVRNASAHRLQGQRSRVLALEASFGGPRRGALASRNVTMTQYLSRDNTELRHTNAKMRDEVERLKRMLRHGERDVHDALEQADKLWWEMDNIVQENCTSNANPYGPSHQGLWRQQASMLLQREKEKLKEIERVALWQDGTDGQSTSARCSGSLAAPSPVLLLETPTPSPEECRDADHWARLHAPTPGGAGFQQPASVYDNISNADALQVELIEQGFGEYTTPIYYLPCDRASGGAEFAEHLLQLPLQYLVPGSAACGPFDMDAFAAQQDEVASRKHPVVALGDVDAAAFVSGLWERGISTRLVIVLGVVRDVLEHRLASYARELRLTHLAAAVPGDVDAGVDFETWLTRQRDELQLEALHGLRREWAGMPMRHAWREMKELSLRQISPRQLEAGVAAPRPAAAVNMSRAARVGVQLVFSDPVTSLCVLARSTSLPIPWESYANATRANLGFAKHEVTSFELHNASLNERVAGRVFEQDAREHLFVALASDQLFALAERHGCLGAAIALAASLAEEEARTKRVEDETAAAREGVDTLGRPVAPIGPEHPKPCHVPYYDESTAPCSPIFAPAEHPMYYFMHTPKTAGSVVSNYLMRLAPKWRVPGAKPSDDFNFTEFAEAAADVSRRPHAVIAFSHLPPHIFLWKVRGLGERSEDGIEYALSRRPVIVLGLLRDTLTQRLSYFDDFVRPHHDRQAYHPNVRPYRDMFAWSRAPTMVVDGATTGDYPEDMQIRPFMDMAFGAGTNNAWKQANMVDSFEQLHNMVSYTGGRLGFVGTQSNLVATLCVMSRVTPFSIPLGGDAADMQGGDAADMQGSGTLQVSERFNEQRPAELVQSFNDSTVREILRRDVRELLFLQLAQARFNALAASTGCMPPVGNGLLRQSLTRQALSVSPVSQVVDFSQRRPGPQCMSGPTTRFIIVSLARSGTTWLESMLKQHSDVHTWSEVVREMAGDGVNANRNVAWRTLRDLAYMPPGGAPGRLNGTPLSRAKRVQGLKWFNLEGGLDLQFYPPRNTTERLGSFLRQNRFKVIFLERSAGLDMHISTYKHERAVKRMRAAGQDPAGREYFCASGDAVCIERNLAEPIALDIPELMRGLNNNERMWKEYRRWANENFCPEDVLYVNYNSFVDEPHRSMDRVFEHLHVDPFHIDLSVSTEKMGHTCARNGLVDPDAVAVALKGTKWEGQADPCPYAAVSTRRLTSSPQPSPLASPLASPLTSTPHLHRAMEGMQFARRWLRPAPTTRTMVCN